MKTHTLKTWPRPFHDVMNGYKTYEFRKNDRDFRVGDTLFLVLYLPDVDGGTSVDCIHISRRVTSISYGPDFGIPEGYCIMSIPESK